MEAYSSQPTNSPFDSPQNLPQTPDQPSQSPKVSSRNPKKLLIWGLICVFVFTPAFFLGMGFILISTNNTLTPVGNDGVVSIKKDDWVGIYPVEGSELKSCTVMKGDKPYPLDDVAVRGSEKFAVFHADEESDYTIVCTTSKDELVIPSVVDIGDKASVAPKHMTLKRIFLLGGTALIFLAGIMLIIWSIVARRR